MPKQLQLLSTRWQDVEKRYDAVVPQMYPIIMQYRNVQSGAWPRLVTLHDMLAERLAELGAQNATAPPAATDPQVKTLLKEIDNTKALCRRFSKQFYDLAGKMNPVFKDLETLRNDLDKVIKEKSGFFTRSNSVGEIRKLRGTVSTLIANTQFVLRDRPVKPDDPAIN
jgi:hypothetical protein